MSESKKLALELIKTNNLEYSTELTNDWDGSTYYIIDIHAPMGKRFEKDLHSLVCHGWDDAYLRLDSYTENGELEDCANSLYQCSPCYECSKEASQ